MIKHSFKFKQNKRKIELMKRNNETNEYELIKNNILHPYESLEILLQEQKYTTINEVLIICNYNVELWQKLKAKHKAEIINNLNQYALKYPPLLITEDSETHFYKYNKNEKQYGKINELLEKHNTPEEIITNIAKEKEDSEKIEKTIKWIYNNQKEFLTPIEKNKRIKQKLLNNELYQIKLNNEKETIELSEYNLETNNYEILKKSCTPSDTKEVISQKLKNIYVSDEKRKNKDKDLTKKQQDKINKKAKTKTETLNKKLWEKILETDKEKVIKIIIKNYVFEAKHDKKTKQDKNGNDYTVEKTTKYEQKDDGIYETYTTIKVSKKKTDMKYIHYKLANIIITGFQYNVDSLDFQDLQIELTYYHLIKQKEEKIIANNYKDLTKQFNELSRENRTYYNRMLAKLEDYLKENDLLIIDFYFSLEGYFMYNNKFIDNNHYLLKYKDYTESEIKKELQKVTKVLKEFLEFSHQNFTSICKYILISPYTYCFKQLGIQETNKIVYEYGRQKIGKTTITKHFLSMYLSDDEKECTANTLASLNNEFNTLDTRPKLLDECYRLFCDKDVHELLTKSRFNIKSRTTADNEKQGENINYNAYNTFIGTTNRSNKTFEGLNRAMLYYLFDKSLTENQKKEYLEKFHNKIDLSILGFVFSKHIKPYIESEDIIKYDNPIGVNNLINDILKDIENKYYVNLSYLIDTDVYEGHLEDDLIQYDYVGETIITIRERYNKFIRYNAPGVINFLHKNPKTNLIFKPLNTENDLYYISLKNANNLLQTLNKGNFLNVEEVVTYLEIEYEGVEGYNQKEMENNYNPIVYYYLPNVDKPIKRFNKSFRQGFFINGECLNILLNTKSETQN